MSLKSRKLILIGTTIALILGLNWIFAYFFKAKDQQVQNTFVENKLKGDSKSILVHFYKFGNTTWFNDLIDSYKHLGIPCLKITNTNNEIIKEYGENCKETIWAEDYTKQKLLKIDYSLPSFKAVQTFKDNIDLFLSVFLAELMILIPFILGLKSFFNEHYQVLLEQEKSKKDAEIKEDTIKRSRIFTHNLMPTLSSLKTLLVMLSGKIDFRESQILQEAIINTDKIVKQILGKYTESELLPFNVAEQLKEIISIKKNETRKNLNLKFNHVNSVLYALGDNLEFKLIISNLIKNSLEANAENILIEVSSNKNEAVISVKDDGKGIPLKALDRMFEYGASFDKKNGNGIGLHHAYKVLSKWKGKITILNNEDKGASAIITLPLLVKQTNTKIVLIDDSKLMHLNWKGAGRKFGIDVQAHYTFLDFNKSSHLISKSTPIFIDYELNGENGVSCAFIVKNMGFNNVSIVTGFDEKISVDFPQLNKFFPFKELFFNRNVSSNQGDLL